MLDKLIDKRPWLVLAAILLLGLFLRTYCLGCESLWLDEGFSVEWASKDISGIIGSASSDVHTPFYFIFLHYWMVLFGNSENAIRSLSAIFSILSIYLIYKLALMLFDRRAGLLSALLMTLSTFHIYFAQEARPYALVIFFTLLSMMCFLNYLERGGKREIILYIIASALMFYTHIFGIFIIISQNIFFLLTYKRNTSKLLKWIKTESLLFVAILPWVVIICLRLFDLIGQTSVIGWLPVPSVWYILGTFGEYFGYYYVYPWEGLSTSIPNLISIFSASVALLVLALAMKPFMRVKNKRISLPSKNRRELCFLASWLFVPILLPFIISLTIKPVFWPRFTIIASPAFYILISLGISSIKRKHLKTVLIIIIIIMSLVNAYRLHTDINKEQWREAAEFINEKSLPNDLLIFYQFFTMNGPIDYYLDSEFVELGVSDNNIDKLELSSITSEHEQIWLILSHIMHSTGTEYIILETVNKTHYKEESRSLEGVEVHLYKKMDKSVII